MPGKILRFDGIPRLCRWSTPRPISSLPSADPHGHDSLTSGRLQDAARWRVPASSAVCCYCPYCGVILDPANPDSCPRAGCRAPISLGRVDSSVWPLINEIRKVVGTALKEADRARVLVKPVSLSMPAPFHAQNSGFFGEGTVEKVRGKNGGRVLDECVSRVLVGQDELEMLLNLDGPGGTEGGMGRAVLCANGMLHLVTRIKTEWRRWGTSVADIRERLAVTFDIAQVHPLPRGNHGRCRLRSIGHLPLQRLHLLDIVLVPLCEHRDYLISSIPPWGGRAHRDVSLAKSAWHSRATKSARSRSTQALSPPPTTYRHSIAIEKQWMEEHRRLLCVAADIRCSGLCVRAMRAVRCACLIWRENRWPLALGQKEYVDSFAISARCGMR